MTTAIEDLDALPLHMPRCVLDLKAQLGEGPLWVSDEKSLYFVDILSKKLYRYQPETGLLSNWEAPSRIGFVLPVEDGTFFAGLPDGLHRFNPKTGVFSHACAVEPEHPGNRLNDGCVDRQGRIWFGTMDDGETQESGSIYRVVYHKGALEISHWDGGYIVSNGPALSPCGKKLYACSSPHQLVYVFDVDEKGDLGNKRVFARFSYGYPDGVVVDSAGNLWCGTWGGGQITRFRPDGTELPPIKLPVANVTKIAFGGDDLKTVYITTASKGLSMKDHENQPQAGGLFALRTEIAGQEQHKFRMG